MNHVTVKTLRFYEEQGLLRPAYIQPENGYRYYSLSQMAVLHQITALKMAGFTLEDIALIQSGADEEAVLLGKKSALLGKIADLTRQIALIDGYLSGKTIGLSSPVLIKTLPGAPVAAMRARIDSYDKLFDLMPGMGKLMEAVGCTCAVPEYCFTSYPEPGYREENILVELCEAVTEPREGLNGLYFRRVPEVQAACIFHRGSYRTFAESYETVLRYIEKNGYEIAGEIRESYIDGVWNKEDESEWLSELQIPVRKRGE